MDGSDGRAWDDMALTSLAGGMSLANAGLGAVHGLAGVIGGLTGAQHGALCGALLPEVLRANRADAAADAPGRDRLDWVVQCISELHGDLDGFGQWARDHGLGRLSDLGLRPADHARVAADAKTSSSYQSNPSDLDDATLREILDTS